MPWAAAAASLGSGVIAAGENAAGREQAMNAYNQSVKDLEDIGIPSVEAQQIVLKQYVSEGTFTPEMAESVKLGDSQLGGINLNPAYQQAEMGALDRLSDIGNSGGMTLADKAQQEKSLGSIDAEQRGRRGAILQDAQQRGGYGSGTALAAQLMSQQEGAGAARDVGLQTQATAEQRALDALSKAGSLGSQLRGEEYGEKAKAAEAADEIAKWNAANSQSVMSANVGAKNEAQKLNLNNAQTLSNANTDILNKQETYNKGLIQDQYNNQLEQAKAKAAARAGQAQTAISSAKDKAAIISGVGTGIGQAATAYGQSANEDAAAKKKKEEGLA